jgi:hypothetical protein
MDVKIGISPRREEHRMTRGSIFGREGDEVTRNGESCIVRSNVVWWWYLECAYNLQRMKLLMVLKKIPSIVHIRIQALQDFAYSLKLDIFQSTSNIVKGSNM